MVFHTLHRGQRHTILCPYLVNFATLYSLPLIHPGNITFLSHSIIILSHLRPPLLLPPLSPLTLSDRCSPATTTTSPPASPVSSTLHHIGPEEIMYQCNAQPCSAFSKRTTPLPQPPPLPLPLLPRCTTTSDLPAAVGAALSIAAPPGPGTPLQELTHAGVNTHASASKISTN